MSTSALFSRPVLALRSALLLGCGLLVVGLFVLVGIFATWLSPHYPTPQNIGTTLLPPFWA